MGHGNTQNDTETSGKLPVVHHLPGDAIREHSSLFVRVIPCDSVAELPLFGPQLTSSR